MEEKKKLKLEAEKQKQLQQREDIRRKMEDEDAGALTKKVGKKSSAGSSKASTQDIFNAHNFDLDINVSEMGVSKETCSCFLQCLDYNSRKNRKQIM